MTYLIISPHIDDAILSIGGFISKLIRQGSLVKIIYVFPKSNWTNENALSNETYEKNIDIISKIRKQEEEKVSEKLGYTYEYLEYPDIGIQKDMATSEIMSMLKNVEKYFMELKIDNCVCLFPLGCMENMDHLFLRSIGDKLKAKGNNIKFYEDMPYYACGYFKYSELYDKTINEGYMPEIVTINIEEKLNCLRLYKSQVSFEWLKDIKNYAYNLLDNTYLERLWSYQSK